MARNTCGGGGGTQEVTPENAAEAEAAPERASRTLLRQLRPAIVLTLALTLLLGIVYPLLTTVVAQGLFPSQANGSLVYQNGKPVASRLIGQYWTKPRDFHGRPSVTDNPPGTPAPYEADNSAGSNLGPSNSALIETSA